MGEVLLAYGGIAVIVAAGYAISRTGVLGDRAQSTLVGLAFYLLIPPLLFEAVADVDLGLLLSPYMGVVAGTALAATSVGVVCGLSRRGARDSAVPLGLAGSYPNAVNMGIPIATQLFGDIRFITPLVLFELVVIIPVSLFAFEYIAHRPVRWRRLGLALATNPLLLASIAGLTFAVAGWSVPAIIGVPFGILGGAAIPLVLLSFGMSLHTLPPLRSGAVVATGLTSAAKLIVAPLAALGLGLLFHLEPGELFAVVALSALPTAQNAFVFAQRYGKSAPAVRDTVFVTTVASGAVMIAIVGIFAALG
ncbi:AEC family transporter [Microbacterium sediminicola]|uniref:AEC family transporter n=1 Tax=Microbacterium sediminicola TaxID=415210 RepID=A0ABN2IJ08_9MICO